MTGSFLSAAFKGFGFFSSSWQSREDKMIFWKTVSVAQSCNHHCLNRMHPVFRLVEHDAGMAFEYFFRYFYAV